MLRKDLKRKEADVVSKEVKRRKIVSDLVNVKEKELEKATQVYKALLQDKRYNLENPKESSLLKKSNSTDINAGKLNADSKHYRQEALHDYVDSFSRNLDDRIYLEILSSSKEDTQEIEMLYKYLRTWKSGVKETQLIDLKDYEYNDLRIDNKFELAKLGDKIIDIFPHLRLEHKKDSIVFYNKDAKPLAALVTTKNNKDRFFEINDDKTHHKVILQKKVGRYNKTETINNQVVNLDQYVYDANGVIVPRYAMRAIISQERAVLAEFGINTALLPQGITDKLTPVEKAILPGITEDDVSKKSIQSSILHRVGTRRLSCLSAYSPQNDVLLVSNKGKAFFRNADEDRDYKYSSPLRENLDSNYSVKGGGLILIDLAQIPRDKIFAQGKRDAAINITGLKKSTKGKHFSAESEKAAAMMSAYRNREIHVDEISSGSIIGWLPNHEKGWQKTVSVPLIKLKNETCLSIMPLDVNKISEIEGQKYVAFRPAPKPMVKHEEIVAPKIVETSVDTNKLANPEGDNEVTPFIKPVIKPKGITFNLFKKQGFADMKIAKPVEPETNNSIEEASKTGLGLPSKS